MQASGSDGEEEGPLSPGSSGSSSELQLVAAAVQAGLHKSELMGLLTAEGAPQAEGPLALPLPPEVGCSFDCGAAYCSEACRDADWRHSHCLLCPGGHPPQERRTKLRCAPEEIRPFLGHSQHTNDCFLLAAKVLAAVVLDSLRIGGASLAHLPYGTELWGCPAYQSALKEAWLPFWVGHKAPWWDAVALPSDEPDESSFRTTLRDLAADSLALLLAALPDLRAHPLLTLPVWGSLIGLFELNNLALGVVSPLEALLRRHWRAVVRGAGPPLSQLPCLAVPAVLDKLLAALESDGDNLCEGTGFYRIQSCVNHSCLPNAHVWK